ncbi:hypothetical protein COT75_00945 [Candidatus Beckwithbacteria bacterium CG10_big_fil_rev_8_21_14_0_10_34_10]|uniref:Fibronectin type-III domain-containing protein n=1 Tax=Candidatus Beckwithbacteria bacterium CG10_big_fil_rev_8_21_14_0_10_34_10 TaxID=1974495 RepID=A0A2H0WA82_9BACT|nr:MAG: hypothetical protein COT75_00945 [Candidatus Beckwithbacteria bacterium CG10_big_fil_rev_8_21_14_0_10_34_10]
MKKVFLIIFGFFILGWFFSFSALAVDNPYPDCGNGDCDYPEDQYNCPLDCGTPSSPSGSIPPGGGYCGDGDCDPLIGEECDQCVQDCGVCVSPGWEDCGTGTCGDGSTYWIHCYPSCSDPNQTCYNTPVCTAWPPVNCNDVGCPSEPTCPGFGDCGQVLCAVGGNCYSDCTECYSSLPPDYSPQPPPDDSCQEVGPAAPVLYSPVDGSTLTTTDINFDWNEVSSWGTVCPGGGVICGGNDEDWSDPSCPDREYRLYLQDADPPGGNAVCVTSPGDTDCDFTSLGGIYFDRCDYNFQDITSKRGVGDEMYGSYDAFVFTQNGQQRLQISIYDINGTDSWYKYCPISSTAGILWGSCDISWGYVNTSNLRGVGGEAYKGYSAFAYTRNGQEKVYQGVMDVNGHDVWERECPINSSTGVQWGSCTSWSSGYRDLSNLRGVGGETYDDFGGLVYMVDGQEWLRQVFIDGNKTDAWERECPIDSSTGVLWGSCSDLNEGHFVIKDYVGLEWNIQFLSDPGFVGYGGYAYTVNGQEWLSESLYDEPLDLGFTVLQTNYYTKCPIVSTTFELSPYTTYYWRVVAANGAYEGGNTFSDTWEFSVNHTPPHAPQPSIPGGDTATEPHEISSSEDLFFSWSHDGTWGENLNGNDNKFILDIIEDGGAYDFSAPDCVVDGAITSCGPFNFSWGTTYRWKVRASNAGVVFTNSNTYADSQEYSFIPVPGSWWQAQGGSVHAETSLVSSIPSTATSTYMIINGADGYHGVLSYGVSYDLGDGSVSLGEERASSGYSDIDYDYSWWSEHLEDEDKETSYAGGELPGESAIYQTSGTIAMRGNISGGDKIVILHQGDVLITENINVDLSSFLLVIASGNITVNPSVTNLEGIFIANNINISSIGGGNDVPLSFEGSLIAWGDISLDRDTGLDMATTSPMIFIFRPDFMANAPDFIKMVFYDWQQISG